MPNSNPQVLRQAAYVFTGGGTGGHLYPALAVLDEVCQQASLALTEVAYIGNETSLEAQKVPEAGIPFYGLSCSGMPRSKNVLALLAWCKEMFHATMQARRYLKHLRPKALLGTGGYVAAPVLLAAKSLGIPIVVHESDAVPGLVNRAMAPLATQVTAAFAQVQPLLRVSPTRFQHTGNPVSKQIEHMETEAAFQRLSAQWPSTFCQHWQPSDTILVVLGGSQGAQSLNQLVLNSLAQWLEAFPTLKIVHQCGTKHHHTHAQALFEAYGSKAPFAERYLHLPYCNEMPALWTLASVALCRAGSMTLSELAVSKTPAILVPYPHAAQNHQMANARHVEAAGAAVVLPDAALSTLAVAQALQAHIMPPKAYQAMQKAMGALAKPKATQAIANTLTRSAKA